MTDPEMPCQELVELVTAYLEDALGERDRRRFDEHLAECDPCRVYLDQMRETIGLVGRVSTDSLSDEARTALLGAFRDWRPSGP
jgi:predicted anti-sigma-YlaC factor YlaD